MLVRELIELLQRQAPDAAVAIWERDAHDGPRIVRLRPDAVQPTELGSWEWGAVQIFELWDPDLKQEGPLHAVLLGAS